VIELEDAPGAPAADGVRVVLGDLRAAHEGGLAPFFA
jgi:hypothetical protein